MDQTSLSLSSETVSQRLSVVAILSVIRTVTALLRPSPLVDVSDFDGPLATVDEVRSDDDAHLDEIRTGVRPSLFVSHA